jgi:dynactin complex subunit
MRTIIYILAGVVVIVLAWFFFAQRELNRTQDLIDADQHGLEVQISGVLADIPGYLTVYNKFYSKTVDQSWAKELEQAANDCALALKTIGATSKITTDEVDQLNGCLTKLYAAYQGTRDQIHIRDRSPAALADSDFVDKTRRMGVKFDDLTSKLDQINSSMDWFIKQAIGFPTKIVADMLGFPKWKRYYDNGNIRYPLSN